MTAQTIYQVDAFSSTPFHGNPAAVCILPEPREAAWMQNVALEMNLSETAFLVEQEDGYDLRWFTPACEVDLCGHATLASAHILWESKILSSSREARFHTRSGLLTAQKKDDWILMDFPSEYADAVECPTPVLEALGLAAQEVISKKNRMDYLLIVESEDTIRNLKPDFARLGEVDVRGFIVTSASDSKAYDFVSRFFAPGAGINEDPVTGSAHCCLAPYWCERLGRNPLVGYQSSQRGGRVRVRWMGDRVLIGGQAITVLEGVFRY